MRNLPLVEHNFHDLHHVHDRAHVRDHAHEPYRVKLLFAWDSHLLS